MNLSLLVLANALANSVLAISAIHLWLKVFGHEDSAIYRHKYAAYLCKLATTVTICGSVANIFAHQEPPITEFILNIGVACNYVWLSWFSSMSEPVKTVPSAVFRTVKTKAKTNGKPKRNVQRS
jgi:hypothetical protein